MVTEEFLGSDVTDIRSTYSFVTSVRDNKTVLVPICEEYTLFNRTLRDIKELQSEGNPSGDYYIFIKPQEILDRFKDFLKNYKETP